MKERLVAIAILIAALSVALVVPTALAVVALALPLAAVMMGPRLELDRMGQAAITFGAMVIGVVATRLLVQGPLPQDPTRLTERGMLLAMPVLCTAAARALVAGPRFGAPVTLAAGLVAITAAGRALTGVSYPLLAAAFLAVGFVALAASDPTRAPWRKLGARHLTAVGVTLAVAGSLTIVAASTLPAWHDAAMARILARLRQSRTAFSDHLWLGSMGGMLVDDRVVLRVRGEGAPDLIRGAVFSAYGGGRWELPEDLPPREVVEHDVPLEAPAGEGVIEIENAGRPERYFLPLGAEDVLTSTGFFGRDAVAIHVPVGDAHAKRVWFRAAGTSQPMPPTVRDLSVPRKVRPPLVELLASWKALDGTDAERLARIEQHLRTDYQYALAFDRSPRRDPVLDFLLEDRTGHCEYFASAFALLGRAANVPTRVVTGYRVVEVSPLGYHVVRQRHAHAWVEAWVDGKWVTYDPTPAADLALATPASTPLFSALRDGVATGWEAIDDWLGRRTPFELSLALVVLVGGLLLARALRSGRTKTRAATPTDPPLHGFVALGVALARFGLERAPAETLERFARRIADEVDLPAATRDRVAALVREYAALRYAGRGDANELDRRLAELAEGLGRRGAEPGAGVTSSA